MYGRWLPDAAPMVYCNQCGANLPDGSRFCFQCGQRLPTAAAGVSAPGVAAGPIVPSPPPPAGGAGPSPSAAGRPIDLRPIPLPRDLPFHPQSDEVIYREVIPHPRLRWRLMLGGFLSALVFLVFIIPILFSFALSGATGSGGSLFIIVGVLVGIFLVIVIASVLYAVLAYGKFRYWVTNHRTVGRRGVIGYSVDSIPLETISDVMVQRSIADRVLGLSSIWIQPFGGGSVGGYGAAQYRFGGLSGSNSFLGLLPADATDLQQLIFHLRDVRRRDTGRLI